MAMTIQLQAILFTNTAIFHDVVYLMKHAVDNCLKISTDSDSPIGYNPGSKYVYIDIESDNGSLSMMVGNDDPLNIIKYLRVDYETGEEVFFTDYNKASAFKFREDEDEDEDEDEEEEESAEVSEKIQNLIAEATAIYNAFLGQVSL